MKNNETGEFELVLGNRQLLSGFFIVVLLFGVAFAMGYIVGRNSTPSARLQTETATGSAAATKDARPVREPAPAAAASAPDPSVSQTPAADATPAAEDKTPAAEASTQPATQPAATAPSRETAPAPAAPVEAAPAAAADAPPGSFWQVIATSNRTAAEALQQSLRDKGFPVTLGPGPNNLVRVLVGPYSDTQSMGRAKTQLEAAGLHPVRK